MACWAPKRVCVPFLCCVFLVVKSTLATVRLSISPVWQSWKEPLFGGQSHPTLITGAVREIWRGGMDLRGGERWMKAQRTVAEGARKVCTHEQHAVTCPFLPGYLLPFTFWGFLVCNLTHLHVYWRHTGVTMETHWDAVAAMAPSSPSTPLSAQLLSLSLFYSFSFSPIARSPLSSPPLSAPDSVVIINTPSSWADAWLESASSPVAGRKSDRVGGEAQRVSESQVTQPQPDKWRLGCNTFTHVCERYKFHNVVSVFCFLNVPSPKFTLGALGSVE